MACELRTKVGQTKAQRVDQVKAALARLETALAAGSVTVKVGPQGSITFAGAWQRDDLTDLCAYRKLLAAGSPALRRAVARAEAMAGRTVDRTAVAAGFHSHDHGATWGKH